VSGAEVFPWWVLHNPAASGHEPSDPDNNRPDKEAREMTAADDRRRVPEKPDLMGGPEPTPDDPDLMGGPEPTPGDPDLMGGPDRP
jgi:hypothetical protein